MHTGTGHHVCSRLSCCASCMSYVCDVLWQQEVPTHRRVPAHGPARALRCAAALPAQRIPPAPPASPPAQHTHFRGSCQLELLAAWQQVPLTSDCRSAANAARRLLVGRTLCSRTNLEKPSGMLNRYWPLRRWPTVSSTAGAMPSPGAVMRCASIGVLTLDAILKRTTSVNWAGVGPHACCTWMLDAAVRHQRCPPSK